MPSVTRPHAAPAPLVVITGGGGFLGSHLVREFVAAGAQVRVLDSAPVPDWASTPGVEYVRGDVRDRTVVTRAASGASALVHGAFASPRETSGVMRAVNVTGTANVRAAAEAHRIPKVVLVSSTIVTGPPQPHPFLTECPLSRLDLYRATRIEAERILIEAQPEPTVAIVRPQSFLGPGRLGAFGIIFELIKGGDPIPVLGRGDHRYQLLSVRDLAAGIRLAAFSDASGVFAFGSRGVSTVREDLQALLAHARTGSRIRRIPAAVARPGLRALELAGFVPLSEWHRHSAWGRDSAADCTSAIRELSWAPQLTNVEALIEAYDWYVVTIRQQGEAPRTHPLPRAHRILKRWVRMLPPW